MEYRILVRMHADAVLHMSLVSPGARLTGLRSSLQLHGGVQRPSFFQDAGPFSQERQTFAGPTNNDDLECANPYFNFESISATLLASALLRLA